MQQRRVGWFRLNVAIHCIAALLFVATAVSSAIAQGYIQVGTQAKDIPLPIRNPKRAGTAGRQGSGGERVNPSADAVGPVATSPDAWSFEDVKAALDRCRRNLSAVTAEAVIMLPIKRGPCGAAAPIKLSAIGANPAVRIEPAATVNCDVAVALYSWVTARLQPAAMQAFGSPIIRMQNLSSYACRNRYSRRNGKLSEHARGNALDIGSFRTADGQFIDIETMWGPTEADMNAIKRRLAAKPVLRNDFGADVKANAPAAAKSAPARAARIVRPGGLGAKEDTKAPPESAFLHKVHAGACGIFNTVLGPETNEAHRNHFHFDLAKRRSSAFCE